MKKSSIAIAVTATLCMPLVASAQWEDPNAEVDVYKAAVGDGEGIHNPWITPKQDDEGHYVFDGQAVHDTTGATGNALLAAKNGETVVNKGTLWVIGTGNGEAMVNHTGQNGTIINDAEGTIYVTGSSTDKNKAMAVNPGGTAINYGKIVVKDKASGLLDGSANPGQDPAKKMINNGTIEVVGNGVGINYRMEGGDAVEVSNTGDIFVTGSGTGVQLIAGKDGEAYENKNFTNTGNIEASGDDSTAVDISSIGSVFNNDGFVSASENAKAAIAVDDATTNVTLNFGEKSQVDGVIDANNSTTLNFTKNTDTISLKDQAGAVNTKEGSNITVELGSETSGLTIGTADVEEGSSLAFSLDRMGTSDQKVLTVDTVSGTGGLSVEYTGDVSDKLAGGADVANLFNGIELGTDGANNPEQVLVNEGAFGDAARYYSNGKVEVLSVNSLLSSATDLALMNGLVWRTQLTNLSDRMGTLRTMPQAMGAWVRYNNGRLDGRGIEHDYNVIELGFDAPVSSNFLVGVSFDYTIGDTDLNAGSADNDTYTVGLYGSYFGDNGGFIDMMAKIGRIDNEYDLSNKDVVEHGDYMMTGAIVGIEAGHRFDLAHNTFIEPQVQLAYSWLRATDYTTNVRSVDFETIESLVARVGVMGGIKFNENRGSAYLKAGYNHDFLGDVDAKFSGTVNGEAITRMLSDELDDNWGDVSVGLSYSVTDSFNTFVDVGTGFGGDIDQKWRVNLGARYTF